MNLLQGSSSDSKSINTEDFYFLTYG